MKYKILLASFLMSTVVSFHVSTDASTPEESRDLITQTGHKTLVIGKVSINPRKHYRYLKPMVDYAVKRMQDLGIQDGRVLMAKDNAQMLEYLKNGRVDWVTDTLFSSLIYEHYGATEILVKKWKKNASEYRTVFFSRKDSTVNSLSDLKGKILAFEDPGSTTAFFLPFLRLLEKGFQLQKLDSVVQNPDPGKIGYVFSYQEINSSMWVHTKLVDAAAFNNEDWDKSDHIYQNIKKNMKILYEAELVPRAFESVRRDLTPAIKARLKEILLQAHLDPKAEGVLKSYQRTKKFTDLDKETLRKLQELRNHIPTVIEAIH